ncbi:hypothetical protein [Polaromonas sp. AET17H-212]|uniref:hypothetical protein n=1 Tax=Polaromonas sp. AET17H-212 TaxID=1977061 RepID=UPI0015969F0A|nr:hypothetical protein [Polaromonas sp. AET17H-212]
MMLNCLRPGSGELQHRDLMERALLARPTVTRLGTLSGHDAGVINAIHEHGISDEHAAGSPIKV